jgi:hypothetical protein
MARLEAHQHATGPLNAMLHHNEEARASVEWGAFIEQVCEMFS